MKANPANLITVLVVAIYLLSPVDFISDVVPVVGQVDDTLVAVVGLLTTMSRLKA